MNTFHVKSIELTNILCFRRGFRRSLPFYTCFAINAVPPAAHYDFDRCPRGGGLRIENPPDRHFYRPKFTI